MTEPPFLQISVVSIEDTDITKSDILRMVQGLHEKSKLFTIKWIGTDEDPILLLESDSLENFKRFYTRYFRLFDLLVNKLNELGLDLADFFPQQKVDTANLYLVLKYETNMKEPMRNMYKYYSWIAHKVKECISYEEFENGFLRFFQRKEDFISDNMDKTTEIGIKEWLKHKKVEISENYIELFFNEIFKKAF